MTPGAPVVGFHKHITIMSEFSIVVDNKKNWLNKPSPLITDGRDRIYISLSDKFMSFMTDLDFSLSIRESSHVHFVFKQMLIDKIITINLLQVNHYLSQIAHNRKQKLEHRVLATNQPSPVHFILSST